MSDLPPDPNISKVAETEQALSDIAASLPVEAGLERLVDKMEPADLSEALAPVVDLVRSQGLPRQRDPHNSHLVIDEEGFTAFDSWGRVAPDTNPGDNVDDSVSYNSTNLTQGLIFDQGGDMEVRMGVLWGDESRQKIKSLSLDSDRYGKDGRFSGSTEIINGVQDLNKLKPLQRQAVLGMVSQARAVAQRASGSTPPIVPSK